MQEVNDEEQALYARLMTRSPVALEAIVDGGRAMYNINGKHVWARKYVKKTNPKINFDGQTSSPLLRDPWGSYEIHIPIRNVPSDTSSVAEVSLSVITLVSYTISNNRLYKPF
ncbi:hypothetical protein RND71_025148 [Anisodus tanguticus]|uniref:Uncharacterized protein n=1 Tax=Anisodus tanguticus TaxID=243964 RepID=A0AAE1RSH6_9SOLA|nr:hypothetical protein RND71_025148 [Anisodus tanguticus]